MKRFYLIFFLISQNAQSQSRLSQFYNSPLQFNPVNTGRFNKSFKVGGGVRSEKNIAAAYNQAFFSVESKILSSVIPENDCFAFGIAVLNEKSTAEGIKNDYLSLSLAYQKGIDAEGEQQIGVGFQTTYGHKRIDPPQYFFETHLNAWIQSGFYNIDISQFSKVDVSYLDLNVGVAYQGKLNTKNYFSASMALHHANRPTKSIQGGQLRLDRLFSGHLGWENRPSDQKKIYSFFVLSLQKKSIETLMTGLLCQSDLKTKHYQILFGGMLKKNSFTGEAIIPTLGLKFRDVFLTLTYDINISSANTQKGASEISLYYTGAKTRARFLENKFILY